MSNKADDPTPLITRLRSLDVQAVMLCDIIRETKDISTRMRHYAALREKLEEIRDTFEMAE